MNYYEIIYFFYNRKELTGGVLSLKWGSQRIRLEEPALPEDKFDYIVSEWMCYFLLFEGMLDSVIAARDRYLAPGGMVLPNKCSIHMVAISDEKRYEK